MTVLLSSTEGLDADFSGARRVTVLSGFLGSGKSTLLRAQLRRSTDRLPDVIVNDFAATPVDSVLPSRTEVSETTLTGGCICCTRRGDLADALRSLLDVEPGSRSSREVVIETSGLSDPGPIAFTLANDPILKHHFVLTEVCVTVDAVIGLGNLERHPVAARQLLAADRLFVTKADLVEPEQVDALVRQLGRLNPSATLMVTAGGKPLRFIPSSCSANASAQSPTASVSHTDGVATLELRTDRSLDWQAFSVWLSLLLHQHGPAVLRVKGILDVEGVGPVALNGVQHVVHRPEHLSGQSATGTRLVIIAQGLDMTAVQRSFNVFMGLKGREFTP